MKHRCSCCGKRFASRPRYERHVSEEVGAAVRSLEASGVVLVEGGVVTLTEEGQRLGAVRRAARDRGLDPDQAAPA